MIDYQKPPIDYYIPQYAHSGVVSYFPDYTTSLRNIVIDGKESQSSSRINFDPQINFSSDDRSFYIFFNTTLNATQKEILEEALEYLTYLGRSEYGAKWKLHKRGTKVSPNCFRSTFGEIVEVVNTDCENLLELMSLSPEQLKLDGYRMPPFMDIGYYKLDAIREVKSSKPANEYGQVAHLQIDPTQKLHVNDTLRITNILHRYLVKQTECGQAIGVSKDNEELLPEEKLYYMADSNNDGFITMLRIICKTQITKPVLHALKNLNHLSVNSEKVLVRLAGVTKRNPSNATRYRTKTFAVPHIEPRSTSLKRSPEGIFIKNGMQNAYQLTAEIDYEIKENFVLGNISGDYGSIRCKATELKNQARPIRGKRVSSTNACYNVIIEFDHEVDLISIGSHNFFGLGEVEPF